MERPDINFPEPQFKYREHVNLPPLYGSGIVIGVKFLPNSRHFIYSVLVDSTFSYNSVDLPESSLSKLVYSVVNLTDEKFNVIHNISNAIHSIWTTKEAADSQCLHLNRYHQFRRDLFASK